MSITVINQNETDPALTEDDIELDRRAKMAVDSALEKAKFLGLPIAGYDGKQAYLEYPDGSRKYEE